MIEFDENELFWFKIVGFFFLFFIAFLLWKYREYQQQKHLKKQEIANEALKYVAVISKYISPDQHNSQKNDDEIQKYINGGEELEQQIPPEEDIEKLRREFRERRGESANFTKAGSGIVPTVHDFQDVADQIGGDPAYIDFNTQNPIKHIQDEPINPSLMMRQSLLIPMNQRAELPPPLETRPPRPVGQFEPVRDYTVSQQIPDSNNSGIAGIIKKRRQPRTRNPLKTSNKITR